MKFRVTLSFFILFSTISLYTHAQTIQSDIRSLSQKADVILTGKVIQQKSDWNKNKTRIYTEITINVDEYLKGNDNRNTISLIQPGGEVGEIGELYTHVPRFDNNEEVLLFIKKDNKNTGYHILDGEAGKITLYVDNKTGEKITSGKTKLSSLKEQISNSSR